MNTIRWFAQHKVAANLIMGLIIAGGLFTVFGIPVDSFPAPIREKLEKLPEGLRKGSIKQEVFPEFSLDLITIAVPYLGAAPEEVEEGVCVRIEEAIQDLDGVKEITSVASEGVGVVSVELMLSADASRVLDDVKSRIDAIETFPEETEKPIIRELTNRREVIDVAVWGEADDATLRHLAERVRDEISALPGVTLVELANARPYEISIEVPESALRRHGLTFDFVANAVRRASLDLPGGSIRTAGGEILLRTKGQAYNGQEFERLVLWNRPDGSRLLLGDVARVVDGFAETDQLSRFDGKPAMVLQIFRVGAQDALHIADSVMEYLEEARPRMPEGISLTTFNDASKILRGRRDLLLRNGRTGLILVFIGLALFLRFRLAFWVAMGMALSFLGTLLLMPTLGVSINLITLFAFILVLGIVVDDAIVAGENMYTHQRRHGEGLRGAIEGAQEISLPVTFAVLTTVVAFLPLLNVPGSMGKIMRVIPLIVIPCLLWSLFESLWILPAHLSHFRPPPAPGEARGLAAPWIRFQSLFANGLRNFASRVYSPVLRFALRWRYATLAVGLSTLILTAGLVGGGYVRFIFFPDVESDFISAALTLPQGTPVETTLEAVRRLEDSAEQIRRDAILKNDEDPFLHSFAAVGEHPFGRAQRQNAGGAASQEIASHLGEVTIELLPGEDRKMNSAELADRWREMTGRIPDAVDLRFTASLFSPGDDIDVQLTGTDIDLLRSAAEALKQHLGKFAGVYEIADSFRAGKREMKLDIKPQAQILGLGLNDLARQVRQAFYGEEAQRLQRGRDDVRVMVRYPLEERRSLDDLENMRIRTPQGGEVPFSEVAEVDSGRGYAAITRVDRRRAVSVTADVDPSQGTPGDIVAELEATVLPEILFDHPGVSYSFEGQQAEQRETLGGLLRGFLLAMLMIFALLAIPLRSYAQPLLIMAAIPFGFVGAVWGHVLMGMDLTILSGFGLVALTGVVVNDSLVMVDFINRNRRKTGGLLSAVNEAGVARFRPILLTSLTTFLGLFPLMMERSMQARFLIPMAVSLAFGVMFATFITLILIPSAYVMLEDLKGLFGREPGEAPEAAATPEAAAARVAEGVGAGEIGRPAGAS